MGELTTLPNIAGKLEKQLEAAGIITIDELKRVGRTASGSRYNNYLRVKKSRQNSFRQPV